MNLNRNKKKSKLVSINYLEYVIIIISHNIVLNTITITGYVLNIEYPKILILFNNRLASSWTRKTVLSSIISKALHRAFYSLSINKVLENDSCYVKGEDINSSDNISCITKDNISSVFSQF